MSSFEEVNVDTDVHEKVFPVSVPVLVHVHVHETSHA
jgi:hypothetical protein